MKTPKSVEITPNGVKLTPLEIGPVLTPAGVNFNTGVFTVYIYLIKEINYSTASDFAQNTDA